MKKTEELLQVAENKISNIPDISNLVNIEIKDEQIWKTRESEKEREKNLKQSKALGVEYNKEEINRTLENLSQQLAALNNLEKHINSYQKLVKLENSINAMKKSLNDTNTTNTVNTANTTNIANTTNTANTVNTISEIEQLSQEKSLLIAELKKGLELVKCPNCQISLRYRNGSLTLGERNPVSRDEIEKEEKQFQNIEKLLKSLRKLEI